MNNIGTKIKEIRKRKGYSQEELADFAKVNLRTIQRIENNKSEPRGTTLNLICSALDITTEDIFDYGKQEDNRFLVLFHLSVLAFLFFPLGNIILPFILFFSKKGKISNIDILGANVLNFQIVWTVLSYTLLFFYFYGFMMNGLSNKNIYRWSLYLFMGLYIFNIIVPIILAIATHKTKKPYKYPALLRIIR